MYNLEYDTQYSNSKKDNYNILYNDKLIIKDEYREKDSVGNYLCLSLCIDHENKVYYFYCFQ